MQKHYSMKPKEVAVVEAITSWWSREMENRVTLHGWNVYLVTFMFNHIPDPTAVKVKLMQDSAEIAIKRGHRVSRCTKAISLSQTATS